MRELPIIFRPDMVRAILDGYKTQTRRLAKDNDPEQNDSQYEVGDIMWVRESFAKPFAGKSGYIFRADGTEYQRPGAPRYHGWGAEATWKPSIHMPKVCCRLRLMVRGIRTERVQDITEEDAKAEGMPDDVDPYWQPTYADPDSGGYPSARLCFEVTWDELNMKRGHGWNRNPWVWVYTFEIASED